MKPTLTWVVGAGGLLGSNVADAAGDAHQLWRPNGRVGWADDPNIALAVQLRAFSAAVVDRSWGLAWCAGAGTTGTSAEALSREVTTFQRFLGNLAEMPPAMLARGAVFVASSAGGLYAGAAPAPFSEDSPTRPVSPYGHAKAAIESAAIEWSIRTGVPMVVGRISNLYGPGQNLAKPQGLISQVCRAHLLRRPTSVFVPLDTVRDYLYAPDCAARLLACLARARAEREQSDRPWHIKVLASQQGVTVGALFGEFRRILRRPPLVVYGTRASARFQARDLRLRSVVWPEIDRCRSTPLPAGIERTLADLTRQLQMGALR
jgi:UDP-glucose 4-epimerase